eukprot:2245243-Pyramimonas_sp.AAC.1
MSSRGAVSRGALRDSGPTTACYGVDVRGYGVDVRGDDVDVRGYMVDVTRAMVWMLRCHLVPECSGEDHLILPQHLRSRANKGTSPCTGQLGGQQPPSQPTRIGSRSRNMP